jgi:hypothetical protein
VTDYGSPALIVAAVVCFAVSVWGYVATSPGAAVWFPGRHHAEDPECDVHAQEPEVLERIDLNPDWRGKCTLVKLTVDNHGETAAFAAQVSQMQNVVRVVSDMSMVAYVASLGWEDVAEPRQVLGTGFALSLGPFWLWDNKRVCFFNIPHSAAWSSFGAQDKRPMQGWPFKVVDASKPIEFDLKIVNESKAATATWHVAFYWKADGSVTEPTVQRI